MKIKDIKLKKNHNKADPVIIENLKRSIEINGLLHPILIQKDGYLISGFQRLEALKMLGTEKLEKSHFRIIHKKGLEAELASLDENLIRKQMSWQEEAIALARRKEIYEKLFPETKRGGDRRPEVLKQKENSSFCSDTASKLGLHERTLRQKVELAKFIETYPELKGCQTAAEARFKYKKKIHEDSLKKEVNNNVIDSSVFKGDCLEGIKSLKNNSVSCLCTDPPYGIDYKAKRRGAGVIANDDEKAFPLLENMLREIKPKLKRNASIYIFCPWKTVDQFKQIIEKFFEVKNILIWKKNVHGIGDLSTWADIYEMCIYSSPGKHQTIGERPVNVLEFDRNKV